MGTMLTFVFSVFVLLRFFFHTVIWTVLTIVRPHPRELVAALCKDLGDKAASGWVQAMRRCERYDEWIFSVACAHLIIAASDKKEVYQECVSELEDEHTRLERTQMSFSAVVMFGIGLGLLLDCSLLSSADIEELGAGSIVGFVMAVLGANLLFLIMTRLALFVRRKFVLPVDIKALGDLRDCLNVGG